MPTLKYLLALIVFSFSWQSLADAIVQMSEAPDWIVPVSYVLPEDVPTEQIQEGVYYLLIDSQVKAETDKEEESYYHSAEYVVNPAGVEGNSQININYDPSYENIVLHSLQVVRDGETLEKIDSSRIEILQRESEMENLIYSGVLTLNIILDDVRVGDIIEYSYSRIGSNPVYQSIFSYTHYLSWSVPVAKFSARVVWNKNQPLYTRVVNSNLDIQENRTPVGREYLIRGDIIAPVRRENNTPSTYSPWGAVQFSELNSWDDVAEWSALLYRGVIVSDDKIDRLATEIQEEYTNRIDQVSAALRFVQDEIRYLGIELAHNSHVPTPAPETLRNRYGDCKDKTVLFLALLKRLGVDGQPALVSTYQKLDEILPNIQAFDHVISHIVLNGKTYWLDPTRKFQRGGIDNLHQPDYGHALVLSDKGHSLVSMDQELRSYGTFVKDVFELNASNNATFTTTTSRLGWNAERDRAYLAKTGIEAMQLEYLDFFKRYYPGTTLIRQMTVDDKPSGEMISSEHYEIEGFWEDNPDDEQYLANFYPNIVSSFLSVPTERNRDQPYFLSFPELVEQTIEIRFEDDDWLFDDEEFVESNKFFDFSRSVKFIPSERILILNYSYRSKMDAVEPYEFSAYVSSLVKIQDQKGYGIFKRYESQGEGSVNGIATWYDGLLNGPVLLGLYVGLFVLVVLLWRIDVRRNPPPKDSLFYPVSSVKLILMWVLTFGVYSVYWFYKNFKFVKEQESNSSMPLARGIFNVFWFFPLWSSLKRDNDRRYDDSHLPGKFVAILLAVAYVVLSMFGSLSDMAILILLPSACLVLPLANYVSFVNGNDSAGLKYNSRFSFRHWLLGMLAVPLLIVTTGSEIGLFASDSVIKGNKLPAYDVKYMERQGITLPGDQIQYFYSDAFLFNSEDGNGFTQRHVFSYWKDNGDVYAISANYEEIKDIEVSWGSNQLENTTVTIIRNDGRSFVLYVSAVDRKDKVFVRHLKRNWEAAQKPSSVDE